MTTIVILICTAIIAISAVALLDIITGSIQAIRNGILVLIIFTKVIIVELSTTTMTTTLTTKTLTTMTKMMTAMTTIVTDKDDETEDHNDSKHP